MAFASRVEPYAVIEYDWTGLSVPTNYEIDLGGLVNTLTVIHAPTNCSFRLGSVDNDEITDIADDKKIDGITFDKVFITSTDANESIKFFVAWVK